MDDNFAGHVIAHVIEGIQAGRLQEATGLTTGQAFTELGDLLVRGMGKR